jgi:hypothetical protein
LPQKKESMTSYFRIVTRPAVSTPTGIQEITTIVPL